MCALIVFFALLQGRLASGEDIFGPLIRKYLLDNRHRVSVEMLPDTGLAAQRAAAERERLAAVRSALGPEDIEAIIRETRELKERQVSSSRAPTADAAYRWQLSVQVEHVFVPKRCMRQFQTPQSLRLAYSQCDAQVLLNKHHAEDQLRQHAAP